MSKKLDMKREYRNSIRTKKMIREAFAELIGEKKRISNISVSELAERADIAKAPSTITTTTFMPWRMR